MNYVLVMRQAGEGCDYTIGCGYLWKQFSAENIEQAIATARQMVRDHGWRGEAVAEALLVPASDTVNLAPLLDAEDAQVAADKEKAKAAREEEAAREMYESLKKKFGD